MPFWVLTFQGASLANPEIEIQTKVKQWPDLILGETILRRFHVCIGYDAEKLYVAIAGAQ